jgi:hypothetical protein
MKKNKAVVRSLMGSMTGSLYIWTTNRLGEEEVDHIESSVREPHEQREGVLEKINWFPHQSRLKDR